jgi:hypothetical protein
VIVLSCLKANKLSTIKQVNEAQYRAMQDNTSLKVRVLMVEAPGMG